MSHPVSVREVAAHAGVSLGTVSNVLNRPDRVSPGTRMRVEKAMSELGFVRNEYARSLRAGKTNTIAYVMLDAGNPFFTDVARGIELVAEGADLSLFLCNSDSRSEREAAYLEDLEERRLRAILVTPTDPHSSLLDEVAARGTPLVIVDRTRKDSAFCTVAVDDELGGRLAIEHLIDVGHRRVAFVGGPMTLGQVSDRYLGARNAWVDAGLPPEDLVLIPCHALTVSDGRTAGDQLAGMAARRRPTAAFCANDVTALGLLQRAVARGWQVPGDLAIVGYDDIEFAAAAAVPLTSVRQPRQELGRRAAELALDEAENTDHKHEQVTFTPSLVARASTLG